MSRHSFPFLLLLLGLCQSAQAGELGRLFYTPQQRQQLDYGTATSESTDSGRRNYVIVNGIVQKHGGNRTVWVNGSAQAAGQANDKAPATAPVTVPGKSNPVHLKVGQRLLLDTPPPEEEK